MWSLRGRRRRPVQHLGPWSRSRLLLLLGGVVLGGVLLLAGVGFAVVYAVRDRTPAAAAPSAEPSVVAGSVRDRIAATEMASVDERAGFSPDPAVTQAGHIMIPNSTTTGPAGVASGFPHTPEGAVGQWAAIEQAVLEAMSLPVTTGIHQEWVAAGGPGVEEWELTRNVQAFLASARQGGAVKDDTTLVTASPVAALVKGSDGPDWVVACVLLDVQASVRADARMGYGLCSRMEWSGGRWRVAAGQPPATAPSAWPGSKAAVAAGWLTWVEDSAP